MRVMQKCVSCGLENSDDAMQCRQCGRTEWVDTASKREALSPWENIAVLEYEVEAEHLGVELRNRSIPHLLRSYHDSALDGLFQLSRGWGRVEAPREHKDAILTILKDLRETRADS